MNTIWKSVAVGAAVALVIIGGFFAYRSFFGGSGYVVPPPGGEYVNEVYNFTVNIPKGFGVGGTERSIVIEDKDGNGLQIVITPLGEDIPVLTEERIRADIPDILIEQPQVVTVSGANTGLAFRSNNAAFGGVSREVWFVEDGNLYQIITYDRLRPLLSAIFGTLKFL
ncbi:MAG: hypothetical protein KBD50_02420 [Candidatus Pacebacteria bacterium]|nr:hypothetical protein [Candidatus Paceibacterota bacterium]